MFCRTIFFILHKKLIPKLKYNILKKHKLIQTAKYIKLSFLHPSQYVLSKVYVHRYLSFFPSPLSKPSALIPPADVLTSASAISIAAKALPRTVVIPI